MDIKDEEQLKIEIQHIFESGANEIRIFEMVKLFMNRRIEPLNKELKVTEELLADRQLLLDEIPECSVHGKCVPHALSWIKKMKEKDK